MSKYWFRRRRFGFGAAPSSWEGWLSLVAYGLLLVGSARLLLARDGPGEPSESQIIAFVGVALVLTIILVWLSAVKTEGGLGWSWGKRPTDRD